MKFILTYDGPLPSSANSSKKKAEIWDIRTQIDVQLKELWKSHPSLRLVHSWSFQVPKTGGYFWQESHHLNPIPEVPYPPKDAEPLSLLATTQVSGVHFLPLVRDSLALVRSLDILFLRKGAKGNVYQGGDLDNRVKTLLDALRVPSEQELAATKFTEDWKSNYVTTLLEDDKLVTSLAVKTGQLLNRPGTSDSEVRLVIEVDVKVTHPRSYNQPFLGD